MPRESQPAPHQRREAAAAEPSDYASLLLLERLESLLEEMEELGVQTRREVEQQIRILHEKLGQGED